MASNSSSHDDKNLKLDDFENPIDKTLWQEQFSRKGKEQDYPSMFT